MTTQDKDKELDRRGFLRTVGLGAGAAAAAVVTANTAPTAAEPPAPPGAAGYQETDHVRRFYELARF